MTDAGSIVIDERVRDAGVAVTHDESIDGWRIGYQFEGIVDLEIPVVGVPPAWIGLPTNTPVDGVGHPLGGRPRVRTARYRESL